MRLSSRTGPKATIVMPSVKGLVFEGKCPRTAWGLDAGSRTLRTEIDLDNTDGRLRPAMYVNARIAVALPETYVLPSSALVKQGETSICFRIEAGKVFPMLVQTGSTVGNLTQVLQAQKTDPSWSRVRRQRGHRESRRRILHPDRRSKRKPTRRGRDGHWAGASSIVSTAPFFFKSLSNWIVTFRAALPMPGTVAVGGEL